MSIRVGISGSGVCEAMCLSRRDQALQHRYRTTSCESWLLESGRIRWRVLDDERAAVLVLLVGLTQISLQHLTVGWRGHVRPAPHGHGVSTRITTGS